MAKDLFIAAIILMVCTLYALYLEVTGKHVFNRFILPILLIVFPVLSLIFLQVSWMILIRGGN